MKGGPSREGPEAAGLEAADREELLRIARAALEAALLALPGPAPTRRPSLHRPRGAFVSLHDARGELRGCVGLIRAQAPLHETVARMAVAAATADTRFPRVTGTEIHTLVIEISALGPLLRVRPEEVEVGRDGLLLRVGGRSGLLLPQVAVENGWAREEFLAKTAWKAGLPEDAWRREDAELFAFTAEVFGERE